MLISLNESKKRCVPIPQIPVLDTNFQKLFINKNASFLLRWEVLEGWQGVVGF